MSHTALMGTLQGALKGTFKGALKRTLIGSERGVPGGV